MIRPGFIVDFNETYETLNISFNVVNISSIGNKTIAAGSGVCGIQTEYSYKSVDKIFTQISKISITSTNSNAWYVFFKSSFKQAELNLEEYGVNLTLDSTRQTVTINFKPGYFTELTVFFKIIEIEAQIGPGWIE